ncbi:SPOR domain-containing protein [Roseateles oligotrophus]|uniref:SPOR domain-containing protein n=1 Tax=Roseateles oligotrophus TaxID=1769250 RepID=A0ABT2YJM3_9BURK|nr:SPOR domain-containing protein [Roseateles oligotrophus]MCV2370259.1 SPOR domain-containing protein [Roseateles oligotrophus]
MSQSSGSSNKQGQRGGFVLGLIVGVLLGLGVALGVALYIAKVPIPFINKVPQRTAEQDVEEAARNKNWDPNAPLAGKAGAKIASGVVGAAPAITPVTAPATASEPAAAVPVAPAAIASAPTQKPAEKSAEKPSEKAAEKKADSKPDSKTAAAAAGAADPFMYFVQAGAFVKTEDAEQQRARLAMLGFSAKVLEREQSGRTVMRVRIGPLENREEAEEMQRKVEAAGIEANLVRVQR